MNIHKRAAIKLQNSGHNLFNCHCGKIHVDPFTAVVNPKGWTGRELLAGYLIAIIGAVLLVWGIIHFL